MVSPLLWKKVARGLSAGRVQSVAVKLLVEREREIKAFQPEEYWEVSVLTNNQNKQAIRLDVTDYKGKKFDPKIKRSTKCGRFSEFFRLRCHRFGN